MEATSIGAVRPRGGLGSALAERARALCVEARWAIATTTLFVLITCWWLSQDHSIPIFDAGLHLSLAFSVYENLGAGHIGEALTLSYPYPPFTYLIGALGIWIGGLGIAPPIIAENLVFVPLLALGCYQVGKIAFGPLTGLLAVIFALGSPLIIAQFHVFMTDAPETAMVAVSVWLLLASERFSHLSRSAAAGVAVGLGMNTKEPFVFFVAGVILVMLVRGGWRSWRGLLAFAIPALILALPWYINALSHVGALAEGAAISTGSGYETGVPGVAPPRFSGTNFTWYFWNITNSQLYAPLFAFSLTGGAWMLIGFIRRRSVSRFAWELLIGATIAWIALTETYLHDTRYSMPLLLYLAVFGTCWVERLKRGPRLLAVAALVAVALANTLGTTFGAGRVVSVALPGNRRAPIEHPGLVTFYSNRGFLVSGPRRDGDMLALLRALRAGGTQVVAWVQIGNGKPGIETAFFSEAGLTALTRIAGIHNGHETQLTETDATAILGNGPIRPGEPRPCVRLENGSGVWVQLGDPKSALQATPGVWTPSASQPRAIRDYCPLRTLRP